MYCEQSQSLVSNKDLARALMFTIINNIAIIAKTCAASHVSASTWKLRFPAVYTFCVMHAAGYKAVDLCTHCRPMVQGGIVIGTQHEQRAGMHFMQRAL